MNLIVTMLGTTAPVIHTKTLAKMLYNLHQLDNCQTNEDYAVFVQEPVQPHSSFKG